MRLTNTHARFWLEHAGPKWARMAIKGKPKLPVTAATIHACINEHIEPRKFNLQTTNTVSLVRGARKLFGKDLKYPEYENLRTYLEHLTCDNQSKRRVACARKWLKRITDDPKA